MTKLFFTLLDVSEDTIDAVAYATIGVFAVTAIILFIFSIYKINFQTREIVTAAVCIASSFALSFIKIEAPYGGSITLASLVPMIIFAYMYGPVKGLLAGIIYGLLQFFLQGSYFLTPSQFMLDFILAFGSIAFAGLFNKMANNKLKAIILGTLVFYAARLLMHTIAGLYFIDAGWIKEDLFNKVNGSPILYSLLYNLLYIVPDCIISIAVIIPLIKKGVIEKLNNIIKK